MAIGYVIVTIYESWNYNETTVHDQTTSEGGLFAQYMSTFMNIKMDASGYFVECTIPQEKTAYIDHESEPVAKLCLNYTWERVAQNSDRCTKEYVTEHRKFYELNFDDTNDVSDVQIINDDCLYVTTRSRKSFNPCTKHERHHCFVRHYSRQTGVVQLLGVVGKSCSVLRHDWIIYRHVAGMYNPPLHEFVGGMNKELGGSYITEYVSNKSKNCAYCTDDGIQVVKVKGFTLNCVASQPLTS